jgi:hypothetical protein
MKKSVTIVLQLVIVLIGIGALTFLLWEPWVEGVNANATTFSQIYFDDPLLAYTYIASIPFFTALYQAFKALGYARRNELRSIAKPLQTIKYCAMSIIGFAVLGEIFILSGSTDDRPPVLAMGTAVILGSIIVAFAATRFERISKSS